MSKTLPSLIKILIFAAVTILLTGLLGATIANTNFGVDFGYTALFTDASGLKEGDAPPVEPLPEVIGPGSVPFGDLGGPGLLEPSLIAPSGGY
jgi:hypothetical protein